jgi:L-ascorbate metabolism protein UlaG (beta-lactamase superfamily)
MYKYKFRLILIAMIVGTSIWSMAGKKRDNRSTHPGNPELITVNPDPDWEGTPLDGDNRFENLYHPHDVGMLDFLKWKLSPNPYSEEKENDTRRLEVVKNNEMFRGEDKIVWLGHASFLIRLDGKNILTDPVFFDNTFLQRQSDLPFDPDSIRDIDYILLSHNHRDHCDRSTLEFLADKMPDIKILTGLETGSFIKSWTGLQYQEAGWYQQYNIDENFRITYVPARHWSRRGAFDQNKTLWGGFFIEHNSTTIYFMGDSGYGEHFSDIKNVMGEVDYAIMGVGAFKPEWFMKSTHISPTDAITAFRDLGGIRFIPMHFGTFDLSDEPLLMPLDILKESHLPELKVLKPGEELNIDYLLTEGKSEI